MTTYSRQLSPASVIVLRELIGRSIHQIYSPCLQVHQRHIASPSFSLPVSEETAGGWVHRYVVIKCEWFETPQVLIDYWQLHASNDPKPNGIEYSSSLGLIAPCTIQISDTSPIERVEIYQYSWPAAEQQGDENVLYDSAIRFACKAGGAFCIACQLGGPGIATEVRFSDDEKTICELLEDATLRCLID